MADRNDDSATVCPDCGTTTAPNHAGDHHETFCLLYVRPSFDRHPSWCRCHRVCGGDQ